MKLKALLLDQDYDLTIDRREGRIVATVDGRAYNLEVRELGANDYMLIEESDLHNCYVEKRAGRAQVFAVYLRGSNYEIKIVDPKRLQSGQATGNHKEGVARILASMPGKVVRLLVELGAEVEAGTGIVVVEAMKMQNELKTPKAGTVVSLNATPGATVNAGDVLAVIE